jgi:uncharacterized protein (DUF433 family)
MMMHLCSSRAVRHPEAWRSGQTEDMATTATRYEHIVVSELGVPMIVGTTMKVVELVLDKLAYGWSPEELQFQHPALTLGQIYSALAYYWDHQEALDEDIARRMERVDALQGRVESAALKARLKARLPKA